MTILGAQLDDLARLSDRLHATAAELSTVKQGSVRTTSAAVAGVSETAARARAEIVQHMGQLDAAVAAAIAEAHAATWYGANALRFREAAGAFSDSMRAAQHNTNDTFTQFQQMIATLAESLDAYALTLGATLSHAEQAAADMSMAVAHQRSALDQVMNTGFGAMP